MAQSGTDPTEELGDLAPDEDAVPGYLRKHAAAVGAPRPERMTGGTTPTEPVVGVGEDGEPVVFQPDDLAFEPPPPEVNFGEANQLGDPSGHTQIIHNHYEAPKTELEIGVEDARLREKLAMRERVEMAELNDPNDRRIHWMVFMATVVGMVLITILLLGWRSFVTADNEENNATKRDRIAACAAIDNESGRLLCMDGLNNPR